MGGRGGLMRWYAANKICKSGARLSQRSTGRGRLGGVICNSKNMDNERELVAEFASRIGSNLVQFIPRDKAVQAAEVNQMTVIEHAPQSPQAAVYRSCAKTILENEDLRIPKALELDELEDLARQYL